MKKLIILILIVSLLLPTVAYAHPGRTDKKGCHLCRLDNDPKSKTECADWGLKSMEYHCHKAKTVKTKSKTTAK